MVVNGDLYLQSEQIPGADGKKVWRDLPEQQPHAFELFLDALVGKEDVPLIGVREAARSSAVMEALYAAARRGEWMRVTSNE